MAGLIPINRVYITYNPSTAPTVNFTYYGVMLGPAKELHDITSQGFFTPVDADTNASQVIPGYMEETATLSLDTVTVGNTYTVTISTVFYEAVDQMSRAYAFGVATASDTAASISVYITDLINADPECSVSATYSPSTGVITLTRKNIGYTLAVDLTGNTTPADWTYTAAAGATSYEISNSEYPSLGSGSIIDVDTVKVVSKNTKYLAVENMGSGTAYRVLPVNQNSCMLAKKVTAQYSFTGLSGFTVPTAFDTSNPYVLDLAAPTNKLIEPGTVRITLVNGADKAVLTDIPTMSASAATTGLATTAVATVASISTHTMADTREIKVGDEVTIAGCANPGNNGSFIVTAVTTDTSISVYNAAAGADEPVIAAGTVDYTWGALNKDGNITGTTMSYVSDTVDTDIPGFAIDWTNSTFDIDYLSGEIDVSLVTKAGAATAVTVSVSCYLLDQITTSSSDLNVLADLTTNDVFAIGNLVPDNTNDMERIVDHWDGGAGTDYIPGVATNVPGSNLAGIRGSYILRYSIDGTMYTETDVWADTDTSSFTTTNGHLSASTITYDGSAAVSITFAAALAEPVANIELSFRRPSETTIAATTTYRPDYTTAYDFYQRQLNNKQIFKDAVYSDGNDDTADLNRHERNISYGKVKSIGSVAVGGNTYTNVISFTTPLFRGLDSTNTPVTDFNPAGEFVVMIDESGYYRTMVDASTTTTTSSDAIYINSTGPAADLADITISPASIDVSTYGRTSSSNIAPSYIVDNFISGNLYIEYEAEIRNASYLNQMIKVDPNNMTSLYAQIGKADPRNWLGFAAYLVNQITSTSEFYVMPISTASTGLSTALNTVSAYRDILHVAVLSDEYSGTLDSWIAAENDPDESRFRIGYIPVELQESWYKLGTSSAYSSLTDGTLYFPATSGEKIYFETTDPSVDFNISQVAAGDIFVSSTTYGTYTISEVFNQTLVMQETVTDTDTITLSGAFAPSTPSLGGTVSNGLGQTGTIEYISGTTVIISMTSGTFSAGNTLTDASGNTTTIAVGGVANGGGATATSIKAYRSLTASEQASRMSSVQSSDNSYLTKILCESIPYTYTNVSTSADAIYTLGRQFGIIFPFALKISVPPHQPLTFLEFSGFGFGTIGKSSGHFGATDFETLVAAGYFVMTNDLGSDPYCIRDVTCGIKTGTELNGILSKIDPVLRYAKDVWNLTRPYIGKYNVVDDVSTAIALKLSALKEKYVGRNYRYLGTLLYSASDPQISEVSNGYRIDYTVVPQDALVEINNFIVVENK